MADDGLDGLDEGTDSSAPAKGNKAGGAYTQNPGYSGAE